MSDGALQPIDWRVIRTSATAGLMLIVPAALLSALLVGEDRRPGLGFIFVSIILLGFIIAGFGAGRLRSDTPMIHGALAAFACYAVVQIFGTLRILITGGDINLATYPMSAILASFCGVAGALFADWYGRRSG